MGKTTKMALVGMDVFWGSCQELDAFDRRMYDGIEAQAGIANITWFSQVMKSQIKLRYQRLGNQSFVFEITV